MTERAVTVHNKQGQHKIVLVCEHASAYIPPQYDHLGLDEAAAASHVAWDPGAVATARHLADSLDAVLIEGAVSRLIYDCNRPPESPGAMPAQSEIYDIPGNADITDVERNARIANYYRPFEAQLAGTLANHHRPAVLVTIHSFTPVYNGANRDVEIGILHDDDSRLADAILDVATGYNIQRNEPYGPQDGVTHTLTLHGTANGLLNVMIEIRNDLIQTDTECVTVAGHLQEWLNAALAQLIGYNSTGATQTGEGR